MTAIELAVEKYVQIQVKEGKLDKSQEELINGGIDITVYELFTGTPPHLYLASDSKLMECFDKIENNPDNYFAYCAFKENDAPMYKNHAYTLKSIEKDASGSKNAVIINPWDSSETYTIPLEKFRNNLFCMLIGGNPAEPDENLQSDYDKQKAVVEARLIGFKIKNAILSDDEETLKEALNKINQNTVLHLLDFYPSIIIRLDSYKSGWGNGNAKKHLIMPIINALVQKAEAKKIDSNLIENFKNVCINQELDAFLYTNAEKINAEVIKLKSSIEEKE